MTSISVFNWVDFLLLIATCFSQRQVCQRYCSREEWWEKCLWNLNFQKSLAASLCLGCKNHNLTSWRAHRCNEIFFNCSVIIYVSINQVKTWQFLVYLIRIIVKFYNPGSWINFGCNKYCPKLNALSFNSNRFLILEIRVMVKNNIYKS